MAENTIKTRIQLKNDTETNWAKSVLVADGGTKTSGTSFIPMKGEIIIYNTDNSHPFFRFKVGDGTTNVVQLPFASGYQANWAETTATAAGFILNKPTLGQAATKDVDTSITSISTSTNLPTTAAVVNLINSMVLGPARGVDF